MMDDQNDGEQSLLVQKDDESGEVSVTEVAVQAMPALSKRTSKRIRAVRSEVINFLSFLSVVWTLFKEESMSLTCGLFLVTGLIILVIDAYFIYCQWQLKKSHAIPVICTGVVPAPRRLRNVNALDDLLSDLPQSIWVLAYLNTFKFSLIAMVCALHSAFSLLEGVFKLRD